MKFFLSILILGAIIGVPHPDDFDPDDYDDAFEFTGLADDDEDSSDCDSEPETDNVCIDDQVSLASPEQPDIIVWPKHEFIKREHFQKTGKHIGLVQEPYSFKRKLCPKMNGMATFACNECAKLDKCVLAKATKTCNETDELMDKYELIHLPPNTSHICAPSGVDILVKKCTQEMLNWVARDPTTSIPRIYLDVRSSFTKDMDIDSKMNFLQNLPNFRGVQSRLYKKRRDIIPPNPLTQVTIK